MKKQPEGPATLADSPFLVPDLAALRRKIAGLQGVWERRWAHFQRCAQARGQSSRRWGPGGPGTEAPTYAALAWVATGEAEWAELAAHELRRLHAECEELLRTTTTADWDTWVYCAPRLRQAIALDWIWDSGALAEAERNALAEWFILDALKFPYVVLHHRIPPHANNQGLAQALTLVTVGYLFGVRRSQDERARHLLGFGLPHLVQQVAQLPPGGYSGEGSTYVGAVETPLMALACATVEHITGEDWFERELAPSGNSFRKILELPARVIPPSQAMPPWDNHGFQVDKSLTPMAYLAHRTGDPTWYDNARYGDGWLLSGSFAWMRDDHVWQWLWMPDPARTSPDPMGRPWYPRPWAEDHVAGTLLDRAGTLHLFQYWDITTRWPIRQHMNPNAIHLEAWDSPLTVDGNAFEGFPLNADPRMKTLAWHTAEQAAGSWSTGCIAAHSCVWVDDRIDMEAPARMYDMEPERTTTGQLARHEVADGLQLVSSEARDFYRPATDVESMLRTSALIDETFWVVVDRARAATPHRFTWQLVLRAGTRPIPGGVRVHTAEQVTLDVLPVSEDGADESHELVDVPGYPSQVEQRCHHFRRVRAGAAVEFVTVLVPQLARRELADWTEGWRGRWDPDNRGEAEGWPAAGGKGDWAPLSFDDAYYERSVACPRAPEAVDTTAVWLSREVAAPAGPAGRRLWLQLPRATFIELWIDGRPVLSRNAPGHHDAPPPVAPFVDVTDALTPGEGHELTVRLARQSIFGVVGPCKLHVSEPRPVPVVECAAGVLTVAMGGRTHRVELDRLRRPPPAPRTVRRAGADPDQEAERIAARALDATPAGGNGRRRAPRWDGSAEERASACLLALRTRMAGDEDRLLALLDDSDWIVRMLAARTLGERRCCRAVGRLIEMVRAETPDKCREPAYQPKYRLREMAVYALGRIGDSSATPALADCLTPGEFYGVHRLAADALRLVGDERAVPALEWGSRSPDPETAGASERAIAAIRARGQSGKGLP